jgi:hypothetical protein
MFCIAPAPQRFMVWMHAAGLSSRLLLLAGMDKCKTFVESTLNPSPEPDGYF